jgi:hypothetical protein
MHKDARLDSRVESGNRAVVLCEPSRNFSFRPQPRLVRLPAEPARPGSHGCQSLRRRDPRNDIAGHQADDKAVGVVENDRGVDRQVERRGDRPSCSHRTLRYRCSHLRVPSSTRDPHGCITLHRRRRSTVPVTNWPPLVAARPAPDYASVGYHRGKADQRRDRVLGQDRARSVPERAGNRGVSRSVREIPKPA